MRKNEIDKEDREKIIKYVMTAGILFGMLIIFSSAKQLGKIEVCEDIGGILATDGRCYDRQSFELYNETKSIRAFWYDPTGTLPKLNWSFENGT